MNSSKSKQLLIILMPVILLVIVLGISYAYFRKTFTQTGINQVETLKCFSTTITDETNAINLTDEFPISNENGMKKDPYTFSINNNCDIFISVEITLEVLSSSTLGAAYVKASLNPLEDIIDNSKILTNYQVGTATIGGATSHILKKDILIGQKSSASYDLRLWIDEATTNAQGFDKTFEAKIVVNYATAGKLPLHVGVSIPQNPVGVYNSDFAGAIWNNKTAKLEVKSLSGISQNINLSNQDTSGAVNLASYIISLAGTNQGTGKLINENGYRYQGANPNNYVSFNGELWRIVGVFDNATHGKAGKNLVKIIKENSVGGLVWNKISNNDWNNSSLKALLNNYYYYGIDEPSPNYCFGYSTTISANCDFTRNGITNELYRSMIENVTWKLGGSATASQTSAGFYTAERGTTVYSGRPISGEGYIGLMYSSDYGYSVLATSCARTTNLDSYNKTTCSGESWLYGQGYEWTLTPNSASNYIIFSSYYGGYLYTNGSNNGFSVRPVLYLKSDIAKLGGDGSVANPYIIIK